MDARVAFLDAVAHFVIGVAQQGLPAAGIVDFASDRIAVPDAGAAAGDGQGHAFFAHAQHRQLPLEMGVGLFPRQQAGGNPGQLAEHLLLVQVQLKGLIVQQA
ncbi:hypothetical protein D9M68_494030 [compost metagenome]